jgi:glycosyltransferase involved in cell wall biosynthesis
MQNKIIIYYPSIEFGGMEKNLANLFNELVKKFKVEIITLTIDKKFKEKISKKIFINKKKNSNIKFTLFHRIFSSFFLISFFIKILKKNDNKKTVILSPQNSIISIIIARILKFKIIVRNGNHPKSALLFSDNFIISAISFFLRIFIYNFASLIIVNSKSSKKFFQRYLIKKKLVSFINNTTLHAINTKNLKKKKYILSAGRLAKQKDFYTLIKSFYIFQKQFNKYKLIIIGKGKLKYQLQNYATSLNIKNKVIFKGFVNNPKKLFQEAKIYVCSSLYEGQPNSLIESLAFFTPVISTNCESGPSEILMNGKFGHLVPIKRPDLLAEKIKYVLNNYQNEKNKLNKVKKTLYKYTVKHNSQIYIKKINELLK